MRTSINTILIRTALVFIFLIGIVICLYWYPLSITISTGIPILDYDESVITLQENVEFYTQLFFYWAVSLPCFAVVLMGFIETVRAKNGRSANIFFKSALILFISSVVFIIGNLIFMILGRNMFAGLYFIVGGMGMVLSAGLYTIHKYLSRGTAKNNAE